MDEKITIVLKKGEFFIITKELRYNFEAALEAIGKNILMDTFIVNRKKLVVTDAPGDGFENILLQKKEDKQLM